jgi:hypothetical protein
MVLVEIDVNVPDHRHLGAFRVHRVVKSMNMAEASSRAPRGRGRGSSSRVAQEPSAPPPSSRGDRRADKQAQLAARFLVDIRVAISGGCLRQVACTLGWGFSQGGEAAGAPARRPGAGQEMDDADGLHDLAAQILQEDAADDVDGEEPPRPRCTGHQAGAKQTDSRPPRPDFAMWPRGSEADG